MAMGSRRAAKMVTLELRSPRVCYAAHVRTLCEENGLAIFEYYRMTRDKDEVTCPYCQTKLQDLAITLLAQGLHS